MTTIKPQDVSTRENKTYSKIVRANNKYSFLEWYELEVLRDFVRDRIELKNKLSRRNQLTNGRLREIKKLQGQVKNLGIAKDNIRHLIALLDCKNTCTNDEIDKGLESARDYLNS